MRNRWGILEQNSAASFVYLKKKITQTAYAELKKITDAKGYVYVNYDRIPGRIYPENALASQLIGYMGDDGNLDYVPEEEYTEELWNEQKKNGERNRASFSMHK